MIEKKREEERVKRRVKEIMLGMSIIPIILMTVMPLYQHKFIYGFTVQIILTAIFEIIVYLKIRTINEGYEI